MMARARAAQAVADLVDMDIPPALVEVEVDSRINDMAMRMRSQGFDLPTYLEATGSNLESIRDELREGAEVSARVDLGLRAVAEAEGLDADGEPLDKYLTLLAAQVGGEVEDLLCLTVSDGADGGVEDGDRLADTGWSLHVELAVRLDGLGHGFDKLPLTGAIRRKGERQLVYGPVATLAPLGVDGHPA